MYRVCWAKQGAFILISQASVLHNDQYRFSHSSIYKRRQQFHLFRHTFESLHSRIVAWFFPFLLLVRFLFSLLPLHFLSPCSICCSLSLSTDRFDAVRLLCLSLSTYTHSPVCLSNMYLWHFRFHLHFSYHLNHWRRWWQWWWFIHSFIHLFVHLCFHAKIYVFANVAKSLLVYFILLFWFYVFFGMHRQNHKNSLYAKA